jgi:hypothetical protein
MPLIREINFSLENLVSQLSHTEGGIQKPFDLSRILRAYLILLRISHIHCLHRLHCMHSQRSLNSPPSYSAAIHSALAGNNFFSGSIVTM